MVHSTYGRTYREAMIEELTGVHVLIVEDDENTRHFLREVLQFWGALVTATTAPEALHVALAADVIVCDLTAVQEGGPEFLRRLQYLHASRGRPAPAIALLPLGVLSGASARAVGFQRHLTRPVDGDRLRRMVWDLSRR
jgi:CheY-like chemotaxis protein